MIRFINLTGQIFINDPELHFAWFDTVVDEFMEFYDNQEWNSWEEFDADLTIDHHKQNIDKDETIALLNRFKRLFPLIHPAFSKHFDDPKTHPTNSSPS